MVEVIEDVPVFDDDGEQISDDDASEKLYIIMELASNKEVMSWCQNNY